MPRGEEWNEKLRFSDDDDVDDLGYGGSSFDDDEEEEETNWNSAKHDSELWDEPEEASLD